MRTAVLAILTLVCLPAIAASKDLILDQRLDPAVDGVSEQKQYLSEKRLITDGPVVRTTVDAATNTVTLADKENKVYTVIPFQTLRSRLDASLARKVEVGPPGHEEAIKRLPPEVRAKLETELDQYREQLATESRPITVTPTKRRETVAGHETTEFELSGGTVTGTVWAAEDIRISPELIQMAQARAGGDKNIARIAEAFRAVKGMPLKSEVSIAFGRDGQVTRSVTTTSITEGSAPAEVIAPPVGFKQLDLDAFLAAISR